MKSWKCSQLWPAECFFLFTVMNFKKLFVRNLKKNMRGGGGSSSACLVQITGDFKENKEKCLFHIRWYCFVTRAAVLSHDVSWRWQMFFGGSFFFFFFASVCLHFELLWNPTFVTETGGTCFWCSLRRQSFGLKHCLTGVPEEAANVFQGGCSSCPLPLFLSWWDVGALL